MKHHDDVDPGRSETDDERADRKWNDMLQELRVMQTGAQLLAGFLLTLPFQDRFWDLGRGQQGFYLGLVVLAVLVTVLVLSPVATHRHLAGKHVKPDLVAVSERLLWAVLACLAALVTGIVTFVFDVVVGREAAIGVGVAFAAVSVGALVVLPRLAERRTER